MQIQAQSVMIPRDMTAQIYALGRDSASAIESFVLTAVSQAISTAVQEVPAWEMVDPTEPPLTPEEEAALDSGREAIQSGDFSDYLTLDEFLAEMDRP